ncbi:AurF N-oxygenase family protein [Streptomyces sp. WI04-05B]|uniref:AurF N-oxygenase family protein n=1 Tax=Streptomyces TaxID=1883 RepID=UPI0029B1EBDC|nr:MULTISPECIES: diiron oxygenase [unclassified Streptomyces]MDX2546557.1 diiron oxygenase [Streptomyces sp. WI04-05B]MDX2587811.1 diiron oxygenase [Streptomyces sp. WI04-05A]MDX3751591.1 diiron oxygenase [Streptomyces sp. AK08-02]
MTAAREEREYERDLLVQLTRRWGKRVAVKRDELDLDGHFDAALPDFPEHLVPVLYLPGADRLDRDARERILSAAWISYNAKTAAIEDEIILPACRLMLQERIPVRRDDIAVDALHQTIIDEHYHILMCHNAVGVTRRRRDMADVRFAPGVWSVVQGRDSVRAGLSGFDRDIVDIAFSLAAETTISGFLSTLATTQEIQPMNRITTDLHRRDESGHAVVFRELCGSLYQNLDGAQQRAFREALVTGLTAFRSADLEPWVTVAAQGGFEIDTGMLGEWAASRPVPARDTGPLQVLLDDLGIGDDLAEMVQG